jgi:hypothetical protein
MGLLKEGLVPPVDQTPPERTHKRAKLIYNLLRVVVLLPQKREQLLKEIKDANHVIHDRVRKYLSELTPEEIEFFVGPRPQFHDDGKLAIYDPVKDNPLLVRVFMGEDPNDASPVWTPLKGGKPIGAELEAATKTKVVVGRR